MVQFRRHSYNGATGAATQKYAAASLERPPQRPRIITHHGPAVKSISKLCATDISGFGQRVMSTSTEVKRLRALLTTFSITLAKKGWPGADAIKPFHRHMRWPTLIPGLSESNKIERGSEMTVRIHSNAGNIRIVLPNQCTAQLMNGTYNLPRRQGS